jgi:transposase-like protein
MLFVRLPFSLREDEHLLHERGIEVSREAVGF